MSLDLTRRDRVFIGCLYGVPVACLGAALTMAFTHAKDWAGRHNDGATWEHWAFAVMIELPAIFGLLLMSLWPKIGGGRKPTVPRVLFFASAALSMFVQQAYAGGDASPSERFVAGLPSIAAMVFIEIVFWVMGLIEEARRGMVEADIEAKVADMPVRAGVGDIGAAPVLSPPTRTPDMPPVSPPADITGHDTQTSAPQVRATPLPARPHVTPDMSPPTEQTSGPVEGDTSQVRAHVTPDVSTGRPVYVAPPRHPDTRPDMSSLPQGDTATAVAPLPEPGEGDTDPGVTPDDEGDTAPDMTDPRWAEAAVMRRRGDTVKAIAEHFDVTTRTVTRWKLPAPDTTKPANGHNMSGALN